MDDPAPSFGQTVARLALVAAATFGLMLAVSAPQLADPLIRWDDFPAYFGDEDAFYEKTLSEGRWLNYWWIARPFLWPAWVNFLAYHAGWAVFSAGAAVCFLGPQIPVLRLILLSGLIALSPQAFLISAWFNTLVLGAWFLALYAVLSASLSARAGLWLFLIFAPVSMLIYSTYPFLLICLVALRHDARLTLPRTIGFLALLGAGIALGMMLMYGLNYLAFGMFTVELADDRLFLPKPESLSDAWSNAREVVPLLLLWLVEIMSFHVGWIGAVLFSLLAVAFIVLGRADPGRALAAIALVAAFLGIVTLHAVTEGNLIPMRALIAVWIVTIAVLFQAAAHLPETVVPRHVNMVFVVLIALFGGQLASSASNFMTWQDETRRLAERVPGEAKRVFVWGPYTSIAGAEEAHILHQSGLTQRLELLTGREVIDCNVPSCPVEKPETAENGPDHLVVHRDADTLMVLTDAAR